MMIKTMGHANYNFILSYVMIINQKVKISYRLNSDALASEESFFPLHAVSSSPLAAWI